jgi:hypothetical protein
MSVVKKSISAWRDWAKKKKSPSSCQKVDKKLSKIVKKFKKLAKSCHFDNWV